MLVNQEMNIKRVQESNLVRQSIFMLIIERMERNLNRKLADIMEIFRVTKNPPLSREGNILISILIGTLSRFALIHFPSEFNLPRNLILGLDCCPWRVIVSVCQSPCPTVPPRHLIRWGKKSYNLHSVKYAKRCSALQIPVQGPLHPRFALKSPFEWISNHHFPFRQTCWSSGLPIKQEYKSGSAWSGIK